LQDSRHLAISIVDEGLAVSLAQLVDDIGEGEKRPVYVAALSESQSVGMSFADSFRASQVDEVELGNLDLARGGTLALNVDAEDGVATTRCFVEAGLGHVPHFVALLHVGQHLVRIRRCLFRQLVYVNSLDALSHVQVFIC